MGKWNNAQFLLSDDIVGIAHNLMADYQSHDFDTFRSRLLELVNGQSEIKGMLNETAPCFQEIQEDMDELKAIYGQIAAAYQEDKYPSVVLSEDELTRLADIILQKFDASVKNDSMEGVLSKIKELTEKKEVPPVRTEVPNYSQKLNQLLTAVNNIRQQNQEMAEKIEELQNRSEAAEENEALKMQEDNQSLLHALNKYKAAYITLKNERNDLAMQLEKLKKENFLRIRRKELQDALIEQKESEINRLKEELAGYRGESVRPDNGGNGTAALSAPAGKNVPSPSAPAENMIKPHSGPAETVRAEEKDGEAAAGRMAASSVSEKAKTSVPSEKNKKEPQPDSAVKASAADKTPSRKAGTSRSAAKAENAAPPAGKSRAARSAAKTETAGEEKEDNVLTEKQAAGTGIERAKKR